MNSHYIGEHLPGNPIWTVPRASTVTYLDPEQRRQFRITVQGGRIFGANGEPFDTTAGTTAWGGDGRAIFVMATDGTLYASNYHQAGRFHHSSFLAGAEVAAAGELRVVDGRLELLTDSSGHYRPTLGHTMQAISRFRDLGIVISPSQTSLEAPQ